MVKIINGEIVQDDDPRAQEWTRQQQRRNNPQPQQYQSSYNRNFGNQRSDNQQNIQPNSPVVEINNRLRQLGVPNFNLGGQVVEPIFTVAAIIGVLFFGFPALLVVGLFWYFSTGQNIGS